MSRRRYKKNSPAEDFLDTFVDIGKTLPWWVTLPTALILFIWVPVVYPEFNASSFSPASVVPLLALYVLTLFFKYLVPLALGIGAVISFADGIKSKNLFKGISLRGAKSTIANISWQDFEFLLGESFKNQGYSVERAGGSSADGGVDIRLMKNGELYLVQCKHYRAWKVSVETVRSLYGVMAAEGAVGGFVVTSGKFTSAAKDFAKGKYLQLIDGEELTGMLESVQTNLPTTKLEIKETQNCPRCGHELVERSSSRGRFMGCSSFPQCRYTASL